MRAKSTRIHGRNKGKKLNFSIFSFSFWPAERADPVARGPTRRAQARPMPRRILVRDWGRSDELGPHSGDTLRHVLLQSHPGIGGVANSQRLGVWSPAGSALWRHLTSHTATSSSGYRGCCKQPEIGGVVTSWVRTLETPYVTYCYNLIQV
jgi:hypothetical protein